MHAYLYLRAQPGKLDDVVIDLHGVHGVRHAIAVVGEWDAMAALEGPDFRSIARTVLAEVHRVGGVTRTYTAPVVPLELVGVTGERAPLPLQRGGRPACYVHLDVQAGAVGDVARTLAATPEVSGVAVIAGQYDVLAELATDWEHASRIILERIHTIPGVRSTNTLVAVPGLEEEAEA